MSHLTLPLVSACFAYLAGLLLGLRTESVSGGIAWMAVPLVLAPFAHRVALGVALAARTRAGLLLAGLACAGAGSGAGGRAEAARDCRATLAEGTPLRVQGLLGANRIPPADSAARNPLLPLHPAQVRSGAAPVEHCAQVLRVRLPRDAPPVLAGSRLRVSGRWRLLPRPVLPSAWPRDPLFTGYLAVDSVAVTAPPSLAAHPLLTARGRSERQLHRLMGRHGPLADALLLGRRETLDRELADRFAQTGLVHLLAISGTHVALLGAVFLLLGRVLRLSRDRVAWLTMGLTAAYLAVIGAPPSALRAGIMLALGLMAVLLQRPSAALPIVAAAALLILALQPLAVLDAGFQLSFAGVLGILVLRRPLLAQLPGGAWRRQPAVRWTLDSLAVSAGAFLATAPIVAHHFGQVAPVSLLANLPAIPLTSLALIGIGAAMATEPLLPPLARLFAEGGGAALDLVNVVVEVALRVPGGHAPVTRPPWVLWGAAGVVLLLVLDLLARLRAPVRRAAAALAAAAALLVLPLAGGVADHGLELAFLDVGQGDALAIRTPAGRWLLVDAGEADEGWDAGERRVLPFLRARGARRLEALVLTHPHADHVGGAPAVLRGLAVARLIEPGMAVGSPVYLEVLAAAEQRDVTWNAARQDRVLTADGIVLEFLWPDSQALAAPEDANDISAVVLLRYGEFTALLMGDAPAWVEERLASRYGDGLDVDVLKAGHHGSRTSTSEAFLARSRPELAVLSAGTRNRYGHPHAEVVARLARHGVAVARTDRDGTVRVVVSPGGREWRMVR